MIFLFIEMLEESLYLGVSSTSSLIAGCNEDEATGPPTPAPEPSSSTSLKKKQVDLKDGVSCFMLRFFFHVTGKCLSYFYSYHKLSSSVRPSVHEHCIALG